MVADLDERPYCMSIAAPFKHHRPFPFCPPLMTDHSGTPGFVSGLTLAQAMQLWWNLEGIDMAIDATVTDANGTSNFSGTASLSPNSLGGDLAGLPFTCERNCNFWPEGDPLPSASRLPRERVCFEPTPDQGFFGYYIALAGSWLTGSTVPRFGMGFSLVQLNDLSAYALWTWFGATWKSPSGAGQRSVVVSTNFTAATKTAAFGDISIPYGISVSSNYGPVSGDGTLTLAPRFFSYA